MDRLSLFRKALEGCQLLLASGQPVSREAMSSIVDQLNYLIALETGKSSDASRLPHLTIGVLAVREVDELGYGDLAELLFAVAVEVRFPKAPR